MSDIFKLFLNLNYYISKLRAGSRHYAQKIIKKIYQVDMIGLFRRENMMAGTQWAKKTIEHI